VGTLVGIIGRWGDPKNYVSFYRPPGWQEKWDALISEIDDKKRMARLKELLQILYDEALGIPYQGDAPLLARRAGVNGFELHANHTVSHWEPENIWLKK
jgi:hypothetical protein